MKRHNAKIEKFKEDIIFLFVISMASIGTGTTIGLIYALFHFVLYK